MNRGERRLAARHYRLRGYRILGANVRAGGHELDLVVRRGSRLVFVEVKERARDGYGGAVGAVDRREAPARAQGRGVVAPGAPRDGRARDRLRGRRRSPTGRRSNGSILAGMSGTHVPLESVTQSRGALSPNGRARHNGTVLLDSTCPGASAVAGGGRNLRLTVTKRQPERNDTST